MYEQKHISIPARCTNARLPNVAFYGNKVVATDSYRLVEMPADGEPHELVQYPAQLVKSIKIPKKTKMSDKDFGIMPDTKSHFPEYQELKDKFEKAEYIEFNINGKYLAELANEFAKLASTKQVKISIPKKYGDDAKQHFLPVRLEAVDGSIAYLMPMNI